MTDVEALTLAMLCLVVGKQQEGSQWAALWHVGALLMFAGPIASVLLKFLDIVAP